MRRWHKAHKCQLSQMDPCDVLPHCIVLHTEVQCCKLSELVGRTSADVVSFRLTTTVASLPHRASTHTHARAHARVRVHTHTLPFNGPFSETTRVSRYQIWILLKQETVSGSGISLAVCKSAPHSRQITTPAPHHSVFYRPDALPAAQPTASKH